MDIGKKYIAGICYFLSYYSFDYGLGERCYVVRFFNMDTREYAYGFRLRVEIARKRKPRLRTRATVKKIWL